MEIWKDITGYEGYYQVSNLGNIKALYREFIGKDYGCYRVLELLPQTKPKENLLRVQCNKCHNEYVRALTYIYNNAPDKCIRCKRK